MDRNFNIRHTTSPRPRSLSARRAWIEISVVAYSYYNRPVALRKESVDRNVLLIAKQGRSISVALRKESVDRNKYVVQCRKTLGVSLSARRAWIEIPDINCSQCSD